MTINVLSIDGGGIRGVGSARILVELETRLAKQGAKPISELFRLFAGTSTGSILAAGFAAEGMTADQLEELYLSRGESMFAKSIAGILGHGLFSAKYRTKNKGEVLKEILGATTLGQISRNFMATFYDIGDKPGPVFANGGPDYRAKTPPDDNFHHWPLWGVVNASSSAPTFFDPHRMREGNRTILGADGGLFANNPAMSAFVEARNLFATDDIVVISVGTGLSKLRFPRQKRWGMLQWASPFAHVPMMEAMFDGQSSTVAHQVAQILDKRFFRFEFSLDDYPDVTMDDASDYNQRRILEATDTYLSADKTKEMLDAAVIALTQPGASGPAPALALPPDTDRPARNSAS